MSFFNITEQFIGQSLTGSHKVVLDYGEDGKTTYGVVLQFASCNLVLLAEASSDTISFHQCYDVKQWLEDQPNSDLLSLEAYGFLSKFEGKCLVNVWQCCAGESYADAVDFGFGDLNYPTLKFICVTSELWAMSIEPSWIEPTRGL